MADFFAELKRRHIYRVGAAYVVVAWALTQLVEILAQVFALPLWIAQAAIVLLALGFPVALLVAWTLESKPHQAVASAIRSKPTIVDWTLCGALAVVLLFMGYQQIAPSSEEGKQQAGVGAARSASLDPARAVSLAVLPFANLSDDTSQEFFSDGITEEVITALARIPDLRVVARESASQFKGERRDLRAVGQALGATHLIEGSVRKAGSRVRITARLVKADDGVNTWVNNYDRELTDVFAIQEEIATSIAGALRMPLGLSPGERLVSNRSIDPESYERFMRGKIAVLRGRTAFAEAVATLEPIVEKNPSYAPGWAALSRAYRYGAATVRGGSPEEQERLRATYESKSLAAARRAIELDPNFVEGQVILANTQSGPRRLVLSEDLLSKALALDPSNPEALSAYSSLLLGVGRVKEAVAMKRRLSQLEPYIPLYNGNLAEALWLDGQTDAAIALMKDNLGREGAGAELGLGRMYASLGRFQDAADVGTLMLSQPMYREYADIVSEAIRLLRSAPRKVSDPEKLPRLAEGNYIYLYVGAPERVLEFYEEEGGRRLNEIALLWHSSYAPVRKTERFKKIIRDYGFVDYWRERGWPAFCRPIGADDFECT